MARPSVTAPGNSSSADYEGDSPERPMLFNLDQDLDESNDLATIHHNRAKRMFAALSRWRDDVASGATPQ